MITGAMPPTVTQSSSGPQDNSARDKKLMDAAKDLEATFLSEMLKAAKFGEAREGLGGGGIGEEQFSSFLRQTQAEEMVKAGGIGLAQTLFEALKERADGTV